MEKEEREERVPTKGAMQGLFGQAPLPGKKEG
jgi:hypothetical protein